MTRTTPVLHTDRLVLEPYARADEDEFVAFFQQETVSRWMGTGRPAPPDEDRALFGRIFTKVYAGGLFEVWAVRRDGEFVGHAEIKPNKDLDGEEIVYALAPSAWGQGLGTELASAIVAYGFGERGLTEVLATVAEPNTASLSLLTRLGFGHVRDLTEDDGGTTHVLSCRR